MVRTDFSSTGDNHWKFTKWDGAFVPVFELQFPPSVEFGVNVTVDINTTKGNIDAIGKIKGDIIEASSKLVIGEDGLIELNDTNGSTMVALGNVASNSSIPASTVALIGRAGGTDNFVVRAVAKFRSNVTLGAEDNKDKEFDVYHTTQLLGDNYFGSEEEPNSSTTYVYAPFYVYNAMQLGQDGDPKRLIVYGGAIYLNVDTTGEQLTLTDTKSAEYSKPIVINSNSGVKLNSGGPV